MIEHTGIEMYVMLFHGETNAAASRGVRTPAQLRTTTHTPSTTTPEQCRLGEVKAAHSLQLPVRLSHTMSSSSSPLSLSARSSLIGVCVECHESYVAARVTPLAHLEHFTRCHYPHLADSAHTTELAFVQCVFLGCERLHALLELTVDGLYAVQAAAVARRDRTLYRIYLLLLLDRLPAVGWEEVAAYIRCQPPHTMLPLLTFIFDAAIQQQWMRQQWQTLYDSSHVDGQLIHNLQQHQPAAEALMARLAAQLQSEVARKEAMAALAGEAATHTQQAVTAPQPFTLSQSRPKALPVPLALTSTYKAREVPAAVSQSLSLQQIEQQRQQRRAVIREQTAQSLHSASPPALSTSLRPSSLSRMRQQLEERLMEDTRQLSFTRPVPASVHTADVEAVQHKLTAATILREEDRYRKERAEEAERLLRFECELRDEAAFQLWQSSRRAEDERDRAEEIARRKAVMAAAQHDAQVSVHRMIQHKQQQASSHKDDMDRRIQQRQAEEHTEQKRREESVKQLSAAEEEAVQASVAEVRRRKRETAEAVAAESQQLNEERDKRQEEEKAEKRRLMLTIQAMEKRASERAKRTTVVEEGSTGGLNLLSDMSMAEMRARLAALEETERRHCERKRERIEADKRTKQSVLAAMQLQHAAIRATHSTHRQAERQQKRDSAVRQAAQTQDKLAEEGKETAARMTERKKEVLAAAKAIAEQLAHNQHITRTLHQQAALSRSRAESEQKAADDRREDSCQQRTQKQQRMEAEAERRKQTDVNRVRAAVKQQTTQTREEADRRLAEAMSECRRLDAESSSSSSAARRVIVEQRQRLKQTAASSNPFAAQASELDVRRGKQTAEQRRLAEERWKAAQRAALSRQPAGTNSGQLIAGAEEEKQQLRADCTDSGAQSHTLTAAQQRQRSHLDSNALMVGTEG